MTPLTASDERPPTEVCSAAQKEESGSVKEFHQQSKSASDAFEHRHRLPQTFRECFETYYPLIYQHLLFMVNSREVAEDLTQEVFLKLYQTGLQQVAHPKAWLLTAASRTAYSYFRSEKSRQRREEQETREHWIQTGGQSSAPEEKLLSREEEAFWHRLLDQLPERDHIALLLKMQGHSYEEIAKVIETDASYVGVVLHRAKERLRKRYLAVQKEGEAQ